MCGLSERCTWRLRLRGPEWYRRASPGRISTFATTEPRDTASTSVIPVTSTIGAILERTFCLAVRVTPENFVPANTAAQPGLTSERKAPKCNIDPSARAPRGHEMRLSARLLVPGLIFALSACSSTRGPRTTPSFTPTTTSRSSVPVHSTTTTTLPYVRVPDAVAAYESAGANLAYREVRQAGLVVVASYLSSGPECYVTTPDGRQEWNANAIVSQSPLAGVVAPRGSTVVLYRCAEHAGF